jgi:hypothetical protein
MRHLIERAAKACRPSLVLTYGIARHLLAGKGLGRLPGIAAFRGRLEQHALAPKGLALISCHGHRLWVNMNDRGVAPALLREVYERTETELFQRAVVEGMRC